MSLFKNNSLAVVLSAVVLSVAVLQGCGDDEQATPGGGGSGNTAGSAGRPSAGTAGRSEGEGGAGGDNPVETAGTGGEIGLAGAGGSGPDVPCDLSFDNSTLEAITDNDGELPDLP